VRWLRHHAAHYGVDPRRFGAIGGENGVVVEHSDSGTQVKVGGDHGIVVDHPHEQMDDDHDDGR
jgi:hypothetical protein